MLEASFLTSSPPLCSSVRLCVSPSVAQTSSLFDVFLRYFKCERYSQLNRKVPLQMTLFMFKLRVVEFPRLGRYYVLKTIIYLGQNNRYTNKGYIHICNLCWYTHIHCQMQQNKNRSNNVTLWFNWDSIQKIHMYVQGQSKSYLIQSICRKYYNIVLLLFVNICI